MREDLERLLDDITVVTLAIAIAVGWSLYQLAHGIAAFVDGLLTHVPSADSGGYIGLTWVVGHRLVAVDGIVYGAVELLVALAVAVWLAGRSQR